MKYSVTAAVLQEALLQYRADFHIACDFWDIASILKQVHCDSDSGAVSECSKHSVLVHHDEDTHAAALSRGEKRRLQRESQKRLCHFKEANLRSAMIRSLQVSIILNADIESDHCTLLLECLEALLQHQFWGQLDGIIGLPHAEIAYLQSLPCRQSSEENRTDPPAAASTVKPYLWLPSPLEGFQNTHTMELKTQNGFPYYVFQGHIPCKNPACPACGKKMFSKGLDPTVLKHVPIGNVPSFVVVDRKRFECSDPFCAKTCSQPISFADSEHRLTKELRSFIEALLSAAFNLKETAELTGAGINIVKDIDMSRLRRLYTEEGNALKKPDSYSTFLSIDEFKLHNGHQYATTIIDVQTRHILWVERGKKKDVVYRFFKHVGEEWMRHVKAVACDMNSDFQEAFQDRYPHIRVVFDHFHIVKNFNDKVISQIRIDEQKRLESAGEKEAARSLKRSKYILTATRETLKRLDKEAEERKLVNKGTMLFNEPPVYRQSGKVKRYEALIQDNKLLFTCDMVKTLLQDAYITTGNTVRDRMSMGKKLHKIIRVCNETENEHMMWFASLLSSHYNGVIAHATFPISSGVIEGVNQKIKTIRRKGYGYPDDEYFFLKIIDASRNDYIEEKKKLRLKPYIHVSVEELKDHMT